MIDSTSNSVTDSSHISDGLSDSIIDDSSSISDNLIDSINTVSITDIPSVSDNLSNSLDSTFTDNIIDSSYISDKFSDSINSINIDSSKLSDNFPDSIDTITSDYISYVIDSSKMSDNFSDSIDSINNDYTTDSSYISDSLINSIDSISSDGMTDIYSSKASDNLSGLPISDSGNYMTDIHNSDLTDLPRSDSTDYPTDLNSANLSDHPSYLTDFKSSDSVNDIYSSSVSDKLTNLLDSNSINPISDLNSNDFSEIISPISNSKSDLTSSFPTDYSTDHNSINSSDNPSDLSSSNTRSDYPTDSNTQNLSDKMSDLTSYNSIDNDSSYLSNQISDKSSSFSTDGPTDIDTSKISNGPTEFSSSLPNSDGSSSSDFPSDKPTGLPNSDIITSNNVIDTSSSDNIINPSDSSKYKSSDSPIDSINSDLLIGKTDLPSSKVSDNLNPVTQDIIISDKSHNPSDSSFSEKPYIPTDSETEKRSDLPSSDTSGKATNSILSSDNGEVHPSNTISLANSDNPSPNPTENTYPNTDMKTTDWTITKPTNAPTSSDITDTDLNGNTTIFIDHCSEINSITRTCSQCYNNYYIKGSECITCSQLNEGCTECDKEGKCKNCRDGYILSEETCNKTKTCDNGEYGYECKTCSELHSNCNTCDNSGYCSNCIEGYYLTGVNDDSKCSKCLSTCKKCESLNTCTECNDGYILINGTCKSCNSLIEGCESCSQSDTCSSCYNNDNFKYTLNNGKCTQQESNNNLNNGKTNLIFERFDSYEQEDNKIHFKSHFILINNFLYNSRLHLTIRIIWKLLFGERILLRNLRGLQDDQTKTEEKNIICEQYGDSLGNNNKGGYLSNYNCEINDTINYALSSIQPIKMEVTDKNDNNIQDFEFNQPIPLEDLQKEPYDQIAEDFKYTRITISDVSNINLNEQKLIFNIIGNLDSTTSDEYIYEINLINQNNKQIKAACAVPKTDATVDQSISCTSSEAQAEDELKFEENQYFSRTSDSNILIINNNNNIAVDVPRKKGLTVGAIIGIIIAGVILVGPFIYFICKQLMKKEDEGRGITRENLNRGNDRYDRYDNSKDIIFNNDWFWNYFIYSLLKLKFV